MPSQPFTFYMGMVNGGVWKTINAGRTWTPIFDDQPTGSIGSIAVAPSDPNVIYVGSGEGLQRPDLAIGDGIYKSTDAGRTWKFSGLRDAGQIGAIVIHPSDPNTVFAAVVGNPFAHTLTRGVYRTKDGGATWQNVLFLSDSTGAVDIELQPGNPNVVYASMWHGQRRPWTTISCGG